MKIGEAIHAKYEQVRLVGGGEICPVWESWHVQSRKRATINPLYPDVSDQLESRYNPTEKTRDSK